MPPVPKKIKVKDKSMRHAQQVKRDQQKAHHDEYVKKVKDEHDAHMAKLEEEDVIELTQNVGTEPIVLPSGVIVMPGDYWVDTDIPYGISALEVENKFEVQKP